MANEKRNLIDRDALIDSLGASDAEIFAKEVIGDAPTVDAVEVVRCKACKHYDERGCLEDGYGICNHPCAEAGDTLAVAADDFCSHGERRADNV